MKKDKFKEHGCEFLNEAFCEESLNEDGLDINDTEEEFYDDDKE